MALLVIKDPALGEIRWEPNPDGVAAEVMSVAEGRKLLEDEITRFVLLLNGALGCGPVMADNIREIQDMVMMLARIHPARLKKATQN